jgi:hypothetical protein
VSGRAAQWRPHVANGKGHDRVENHRSVQHRGVRCDPCQHRKRRTREIRDEPRDSGENEESRLAAGPLVARDEGARREEAEPDDEIGDPFHRLTEAIERPFGSDTKSTSEGDRDVGARRCVHPHGRQSRVSLAATLSNHGP